MLVIGHRGFSGKYPENTMLAFQKAVEAGCDGIELDVQLTKDGLPVIIHDETIERTSDGNGRICDKTYKELLKLDFAYPSKYHGVYGKQHLPSLEEYLSWVAEEAVSITTNIELKNGFYYFQGMEKKVIVLIQAYHLEERVILSSLNTASLTLCKNIDPDISCGFLVEKTMGNAGVYAREFGIEYYHPNVKYLEEEDVKSCAQSQIGIHVWTVNEAEDLKRMKQWGVRAVITNEVALAHQITHGQAG